VTGKAFGLQKALSTYPKVFMEQEYQGESSNVVFHGKRVFWWWHDAVVTLLDYQLSFSLLGQVSAGMVVLVEWHSGRTSVSNWRTFPVLRSTCS